MKNVFIEMEKLKDLNSGLGQFCFHLGSAISKLDPVKFNPYFFVPKEQVGVFGKYFEYLKANHLYRYFPLRKKFDIWHCLEQGSPYLPMDISTKVILTIHDLNFIEEKKNFFKRKLRLWKLQRMVNRADVITVISKYTEKVVRENLAINNTPIHVIYNGNSLTKFDNLSNPRYQPEGKFFFALGIISPKKNFKSLIPILNHFKEYKLVIAGNKNHSYANELLAIAKKLGVEKQVILPGKISDEEKYWYYRHCSAFLFPSIAEGFGLPVIEAMSVGKPVFLSRSTSLPEVGGEEAFYFDNFDASHMASIIEEGLLKWSNDSNKKNRAIEWANKFTWQKSAEAYQQLYLSL
jgi:glycosyltransferase involved in cell wall biosynthesis